MHLKVFLNGNNYSLFGKKIWDYILWWAFILCMQSIITTMCLTEAVLEAFVARKENLDQLFGEI